MGGTKTKHRRGTWTKTVDEAACFLKAQENRKPYDFFFSVGGVLPFRGMTYGDGIRVSN